jgi:hypothetical protein
VDLEHKATARCRRVEGKGIGKTGGKRKEK